MCGAPRRPDLPRQAQRFGGTWQPPCAFCRPQADLGDDASVFVNPITIIRWVLYGVGDETLAIHRARQPDAPVSSTHNYAGVMASPIFPVAMSAPTMPYRTATLSTPRSCDPAGLSGHPRHRQSTGRPILRPASPRRRSARPRQYRTRRAPVPSGAAADDDEFLTSNPAPPQHQYRDTVVPAGHGLRRALLGARSRRRDRVDGWGVVRVTEGIAPARLKQALKLASRDEVTVVSAVVRIRRMIE